MKGFRQELTPILEHHPSSEGFALSLMIDVLIVDDHAVMRELLRQIADRYPNLAIVAEAATGEEAVRDSYQSTFSLDVIYLF